MEQTTASNPKSSAPLLERFFGLSTAGTDPRTEFVAGLTTFLTMVYIVFVNPQILGNSAVFVATCIAAAVSTLVMALYANYPIALAPGMGLNAFFAFTDLAAGARRGILLGRDLLFHLDLPHSRIHHQCDPAESETGDVSARSPALRWHAIP
jgi:hypothetical protein